MLVIGNRPKGVQVQIKDTLNNKSKSFTVHGISFQKLFYKILFYTQQITKYANIKLVCYKEVDKNGEKRTGSGREEDIRKENS